MSKTAAMIVTLLDDGSFLVLDANGKTHEAFSEQELARVCLQIVHDPTLPQYDTQQAAVADAEEMLAKVAEAVLPEKYSFLAAPGVGALKKAMTKLQAWTASEPIRRIQNTPESLRAGQEQARQRLEEKERMKEQARRAFEQREKQRPRLKSVRP